VPLEVSIVSRAANKRRWLLFKSDEDVSGGGSEAVDTSPEAIVPTETPLEEEQTSNTTGLTDAAGPLDAPKPKESENEMETLSKMAMEQLPDEMRGIIETLYKSHEDAVKKAEELETILRAKEEKEELEKFTLVAKSLDQISAPESELANALWQRAKADAKAYETIHKALLGANEAIKKGSLYRELGGNWQGEGPRSAWDKIDALAKSLISKGSGLSYADAVSNVLEASPELYSEYLKEGM